MLNYEDIGRRIKENRKQLLGKTQDQMAADLFMYQADISNLEKAKAGSGITDLTKLEMIADYFGIPLESLLFGRRNVEMEKYSGSKMQIKESGKGVSKKHKDLLRKLTGSTEELTEEQIAKLGKFECGPYSVYIMYEYQYQLGALVENDPVPYILKPHIYVLYEDEVVGSACAFSTIVMQHVFQPAFERLKDYIHADIFDLDESYQILNPYWMMYLLSLSEEEQEKNRVSMVKRMDVLRKSGENRSIFYVESAFVREDCRKNGIFRMMIDTLKIVAEDPIIWLSLEPTYGEDLDSEYSYHASYKPSEIGQINLNASIAEHLGFYIDLKTTALQTERVQEDGTVKIEKTPVRRAAYYLPKVIKELIKDDKNVLSLAKARRKAVGLENLKPKYIDVYQGAWKEKGFVMAIKMVYDDETVFAFTKGMTWASRWLGVSYNNPENGEDVDTIERYQKLKEAENSKYYTGLKVSEQLYGAIFFRAVKPEEVELDELTKQKI